MKNIHTFEEFLNEGLNESIGKSFQAISNSLSPKERSTLLQLSKNVVDRLYNEVVKALAQPTLRQNLATGVVGYVPDGSPPEQFSKQVRDDVKRYSEILQKLNIQPS